LITLGIIGIVAALTMPALVASYQKHVTETALKCFYSNMNQAIRLSAADMGKVDLAGFPFAQSSTAADIEAWFKEYLQPYIKTIRVEGNLVYFPDGSMDKIGYYGHDHTYYINAKRTAVKGKDYFLFAFYPDSSGEETPEYAAAIAALGREPFKSDNTNKGLEAYISYSWDGTRADLHRANGHVYMIQENGWTIPDDYPVKF
jgi:type II secretory pathway pseudopilin PulG